MNAMPNICSVVLTLPANDTWTLARSPIVAIHSRSADIVISRPMMIIAMMSSNQRDCACTSITSTIATISLSATGSRNSPNRDVWPKRRATQPSMKSVTAAIPNRIAAIGRAFGSGL